MAGKCGRGGMAAGTSCEPTSGTPGTALRVRAGARQGGGGSSVHPSDTLRPADSASSWGPRAHMSHRCPTSDTASPRKEQRRNVDEEVSEDIIFTLEMGTQYQNSER